MPHTPKTHYRSVFISDVHLGTADCQADYLLDFLTSVRCDTLYLVGDIVDLIAMQRRVHFPPQPRSGDSGRAGAGGVRNAGGLCSGQP